jgi:hypothetical protein
LGTSREHDENTLKTRKKNKKKTPPTPPLRGRNRAHLGSMKFLFPKLLLSTFGLG